MEPDLKKKKKTRTFLISCLWSRIWEFTVCSFNDSLRGGLTMMWCQVYWTFKKCISCGRPSDSCQRFFASDIIADIIAAVRPLFVFVSSNRVDRPWLCSVPTCFPAVSASLNLLVSFFSHLPPQLGLSVQLAVWQGGRPLLVLYSLHSQPLSCSRTPLSQNICSHAGTRAQLQKSLRSRSLCTKAPLDTTSWCTQWNCVRLPLERSS